MSVKNKSEFGKGLVYNLGLFLAHSERYNEFLKTKPKGTKINYEQIYTEMWFNGASDHFYELQVPVNFPEKLKRKLKKLKSKCLHFGHGFSAPFPTEKDVYKMLDLAKEILRDIDKLNGIEVIKATWE